MQTSASIYRLYLICNRSFHITKLKSEFVPSALEDRSQLSSLIGASEGATPQAASTLNLRSLRLFGDPDKTFPSRPVVVATKGQFSVKWIKQVEFTRCTPPNRSPTHQVHVPEVCLSLKLPELFLRRDSFR